jgi:hypothetical protein
MAFLCHGRTSENLVIPGFEKMIPSEITRAAFRCTVAPEQSAGRMQLGWRYHDVRVIDTSREAFTLQVSAATFRRIKEGSRAVLEFNGENLDVECKDLFRMMDERFHVTMARVRDRTTVRGPRTSFWSLLPTINTSTDPVLPLALLISFLLACVSLPGMGDSLGTAPLIRKAVQDVWRKTTGG